MTPQELMEQRSALVEARSSGAMRVVFHSGGTRREVEYRSVKEIQAAIDALDRELRAHAPIRTFLPHFSKGF